jgi:hypothetical protein
MSEFRQDNTPGFTDAQLAAMNDEFYHNLALAFGDLPDGLEGADADLIEQITQTTAEAVLRRHGSS